MDATAAFPEKSCPSKPGGRAEPAVATEAICASSHHLNSTERKDSLRPYDFKHFLCTIEGPDSSYSFFVTHICWKVLKDDKMEPPIHTEYLRSGGATTLIFIVDGARAVSSLVMRSPIPGNMVVPPESTTFAYKSLRISTSPC